MTRQILLRYARLLGRFRNGWQMVRTLRGGPPCDAAVLWDGTRLTHPPGHPGLVEAITELWLEQPYTRGGFYRPRPGDVVVDAGANIGLFSVWVTRREPRCRVVALEPFAENFEHLVANLRASGLGPDRAEAHRVALGAAYGSGRMVSVGDRSLDHTLTAGTDPGAAASTPIIPLEALFELARSDRIALLKVDIEGSERDVFEGAGRDTLSRFDRVALEYHDNLRPGTLDLLKDRLGSTHRLESFPSECPGCGILLGTLAN